MPVTITRTLLSCALLCLPLLLVTCHRDFQLRIPNGDKVPHPCKKGRTWHGVGHELVVGSGARNKFGRDFNASGQVWSSELCQKDSDGDGLTNGMELGDPECRWRPGLVPEIVDVKRLSHPGIYTCTSWDDPECQEKTGDVEWISDECNDANFDCPAMEEEGVVTEEIRLPEMRVPGKTTTYMCMDYIVQSAGPLHMVATTPLIKESKVVHHMLLFGCDPENDVDFLHRPGQPYECGMLPACRGSIISMWSYGMHGDCSYNNVGFRLGRTGYRRLSLQVHWNNRFHSTEMTDASGLTLYLTNNLREHDAGVWVIGSVHLDIPPQTPNVVAKATCDGKCTENYMSGPVYVTGLLNHMHYLGQSMKVEIIRNGVRHLVVGDVEYNYDTPNFHVFERPFEVRPGDELRTTCEYNSVGKNVSTKWGESSDDEMCFAFVTFFPDQRVSESMCYSWEMVPHCYTDLGLEYDGCNITDFLQHGTNGWMEKWLVTLRQKCSPSQCRPDTCMPVVYDLRSQPCLRGKVYSFLRHNIVSRYNIADQQGIVDRFTEFHKLYTSCDTYVHTTTARPAASADSSYRQLVPVLNLVALILIVILV